MREAQKPGGFGFRAAPNVYHQCQICRVSEKEMGPARSARLYYLSVGWSRALLEDKTTRHIVPKVKPHSFGVRPGQGPLSQVVLSIDSQGTAWAMLWVWQGFSGVLCKLCGVGNSKDCQEIFIALQGFSDNFLGFTHSRGILRERHAKEVSGDSLGSGAPRILRQFHGDSLNLGTPESQRGFSPGILRRFFGVGR